MCSAEERRLHPCAGNSALHHFGEISRSLEGRLLLLLLDYDGTLAPIVNDPSKAFMPDATRHVLEELPKYCTTGVITGRSVEKITAFVGVDNLIYAGSHGFDIVGPDSSHIRHQVAAEHLPRLSVLRQQLEELIVDIPGASVEDNLFAVTVHYRNCSEEHVPLLFARLDRMLSAQEGFRRGSGKKVVELRPDVAWNKGHAVRWLLDALHLSQRSDVFTLYLGDDTTDEDAFRVFCGGESETASSDGGSSTGSSGGGGGGGGGGSGVGADDDDDDIDGEDVDGAPLDEDLDGEPLDGEDIDGAPLNDGDDDEDIDGVPLDEPGGKGAPAGGPGARRRALPPEPQSSDSEGDEAPGRINLLG
eukprot:CAMPEP_0198426738 /NCGR_PEP_ID=MMETSP1452-20131203/5448_1 /TAXON_ID=1181717 /ORGANISM="Synchroma pusillum, Strain CCMP3072" /LENGTH=359 /DNA_ID=CAMNT_0044147111 /DNA_START=36 /DNA_END=1115 /DNA_ORIENTATION=-